MTFVQILALARKMESTSAVAAWFAFHLGESQPCGFEPPVVDPGMVSILDGSEDPQPAYQLTPREARWFAAALLRAADEAEDKERDRG